MNFIRLCLTRPVGVSVGVLLVLLFGLLALFAIPVQLTPNVDVPYVSVETSWPGANPQEVEREIIDRQEEMLRSVKGMRKMTSSSRDNSGTINLEFYTGVDKNDALRDVTDKLRQVSGYPLEVDEPIVAAADPTVASPIAWLILFTREGDDAKVRELADFARDNIKPYLDRVEGVASTDVYGGMEREVQVSVDAGELAVRGLTFGQVMGALRQQNANISAGRRTQGKRDYAIRTVGQYEDLDEIRATVLAYTDGGPVYVRDVAEVASSFKKAYSFVRSKGQYVLAIPVRREVGANVIEVMDGVKEAIARINSEVLAARNMPYELVQVYDETVYIKDSIRMVQTNIVYGGILAIAVLMLFLRNWRATLVVALSIPIAVIGTFLVVVVLGRTLNVISLAGIAFAVGMVVDSAVVVLENIYRHRQMGKNYVDAALEGVREVWGAVLAGTLTTMAVFIPVIFVQEEAGQLFRDISIAIAAAVGLSLIVAVTVIPVLSTRLLRLGKHDTGDAARPGAPATEGSEASGGRMAGFLAELVDAINGRPWVRLALIVLMTGGSLGLATLFIPEATYLPAGNRNLVFGFLLTPPGYSLDEYRRMADSIEGVVGQYWSIEPDSPAHHALDERWRQQIEGMIAANAIPELIQQPNGNEAGGPISGFWRWLERKRLKREWLTPPPLIDNFFYVTFGGGCFMGCSSVDPALVKPLTRLLQTSGQQIPGVYAIFNQSTLFSFGGGNNAEIEIRGDDLDQVTQAAIAMRNACLQRFGFPNPSPANFDLGRPEVRLIPDRERAADLGLSVTDVGLIVEACADGAYVGDYRQRGDIIDISLYVQGQRGRPTQEIGQVPMYTPAGQIVPLASAAELIDTTALEQINHAERQRAVSLVLSPPETLALESVIRQIKEEIEPELRESGQIGPDVLIALTGNADKLVAARNTMIGEWKGFSLESLTNLLGSRFFLSILIVYLLMAALFENWIYPFVIMFSVPLAIFGGFLGLSIARAGTLMSTNQPIQQLDVLTFLGFVILVGVVVNNAILLVYQSLHNMREAGMEGRMAIREAVRVRVRPVFMTGLTTFFGQLPLALFPGSGSELYRGLAAVTLGGLLIATLGTLVLVPSVLGLVVDLRARLSGRTESASIEANGSQHGEGA